MFGDLLLVLLDLLSWMRRVRQRWGRGWECLGMGGQRRPHDGPPRMQSISALSRYMHDRKTTRGIGGFKSYFTTFSEIWWSCQWCNKPQRWTHFVATKTPPMHQQSGKDEPDTRNLHMQRAWTTTTDLSLLSRFHLLSLYAATRAATGMWQSSRWPTLAAKWYSQSNY